MSTDKRIDGGRKPRSYYVDYSKNRSKDRRRGVTSGFGNNSRYKEAPDISFGHTGFLITSIDEVKSYLEMRNIFEEYFEELYAAKSSGDQEANKKNTTTEDELEAELKQLRRNRPFKQVKTHCRNSLFINITKDFSHVDPVIIVDRFFDELAEKRQMRSSNTFKVLPILDTFRNSAACAKESISNLLQTRFKDESEPRKYFIEFQSRGNYKLNPEDKQKMIEGVADTVAQVKPNWTVDRENANYIIVLVSLKNVCCATFLKDYFKRSKYNVIEFCKDFDLTIQSSAEHSNQEAEDEKLDDPITVGDEQNNVELVSEHQA